MVSTAIAPTVNSALAHPYLGHIKLDRLTPAHLQGLYARLLGQGLSTATVRQAHSLLAAALRKAVK